MFWRRKTNENPQEPNAYIADYKEGLGKAPIFLEPEIIPPESRPRWYKGKLYHWLSKDDTGYHVIDAPKSIKARDDPREVFTALNCPHIELVFGIPDTIWDKTGRIALYILIAAEMAMLFLIFATSLR